MEDPARPIATAHIATSRFTSKASTSFVLLCWVRRAVALLVLATFVPTAIASAACDLACQLASRDANHRADLGAQTRPAPQLKPHATPADPALHVHLEHGGPCHLSVVPALAPEPLAYASKSLARSWDSSFSISYASHVGPPPEHRPRSSSSAK